MFVMFLYDWDYLEGDIVEYFDKLENGLFD
jgi:hypothetical protein